MGRSTGMRRQPRTTGRRCREDLGGADARDGHHRPAGVHELSLLVVLEALGVGAEAEGIEAEVTGEGAVEVSGRDGGVLEPALVRAGWGLDGWSGRARGAVGWTCMARSGRVPGRVDRHPVVWDRSRFAPGTMRTSRIETPRELSRSDRGIYHVSPCVYQTNVMTD